MTLVQAASPTPTGGITYGPLWTSSTRLNLCTGARPPCGWMPGAVAADGPAPAEAFAADPPCTYTHSAALRTKTQAQ